MGERCWTLDVPCGELLTSNELGLAWGRRLRITRRIQADVGWLVRRWRVPPLAAARIDVEVLPPDRRRRDPDNWQPSAKAAIDGLVAMQVIPDDNPTYVTGVTYRAGQMHAHACMFGRGGVRRRRVHLRLIIREVLR